ncbi:MAG: ABC transporter ATP-binding protein [Gemmatimonadota bacterium]
MSHLRTLIPYFRPYRRGLAWGLLLVVISNVFTIAGPWLLKTAIDGLEDPEVSRGRIAGLAGLLVVAALLGGAARYGMRELLNGISRKIECDLRMDLFRQFTRLDATFYGTHRTGDLMARATNDTLAVRMAVGPAVMYTVNTAVTFSFALAVLLWISPRLTGVALLPMLLLPPVVLGFGRVINRRFDAIQEHFSTLSTMIQENLTGVRIVRAYGQEAAQADDFLALNREYRSRNMALVYAAGLFHPILALLSGTAMVLVLWVGGREVISGAISVGDFVAAAFYLGLLTWPLIALGWVVNLFQRGAASMARLNQILEHSPEIEPHRGSSLEPAIKGGVAFRNVSFRYPGTERWVLKELSFQVEPGETVAVVGPTGSGKSTLVSLLPRTFDPQEGTILLDGKPLGHWDVGSLRAAMGVVPQDPFLFSDTLGANLALGLPEEELPVAEGGLFEEPSEAHPRIRKAVRIAQLEETIRHFPRGYNTMLGERGLNLSGGQKQRATLARALARDPAILILDDALSAVDTRTEARILDELRVETGNRTCFIISHRVSAVMHSDRILVLKEGRLVEQGTHSQLLAAGGVYAHLLRRQLLEEDLGVREEALVAADGS